MILTSLNNKASFVQFLLVFFTVIISDDTLTFGTIGHEYGFYLIKLILYSLFAICLTIKNFGERGTAKSYFLLCYFVGIILLSQLFNLDFVGGYEYQIVVLYLSLQIAIACDVKVFFVFFKNIVTAISAVSLIIFFTYNTFPSVFDIFPTHINLSGTAVKNIFVSYVYIQEGLYRNAGIFREPGVLAVYIVIALLLELHLSDAPNKINIVILLIALLTTYSTSGYFVTLFLLISHVKYYLKKSNVVGVVLVFLMVGVFALTLFNLYSGNSLINKFNASSDTYISTLTRLASLIVPFRISLDNPIIGVGQSDYVVLFLKYSLAIFGVPLSASGQSTNTFTSLIATYGWFFGVVVLIILFKFSRSLSKNKFLSFFVYITFVLLFSSQDMRYSLMFFVFIFIGLKVNNSYFKSYKY